MYRTYDHWERLVTATLRREHLRILAQRSPSELSLSSSSSPSPSFSSFSPIPSSPNVSTFNFSCSVGDSFSYDQILQATDNLIESNLIKHGGSGDLYHGVLEGGIQAVVKKIDLSSKKKESLFISELEILGKVSHHRLVPLLGHCLGNENEKFLVYKNMPNKDLSSCLPSLDWRTRLKIATGAAEILSYLHHEFVPPLVHRDIQASTILLDDWFEVRIGSLSHICTEDKNISQKAITKFLHLPKGSGQGILGTSNAMLASDVHCFGKVLLELITGKLNFSAGNHSTMNDWMETSLACIDPHNEELVVKILDPSLILNKHLLGQAWSVALVAKACLSPKSSNRPQMAHIRDTLEHIKSPRFTSYEFLQSTGELYTLGPAHDIAKLLEGFDEIGRIYEAYPSEGMFTHQNLTICSFPEFMDECRNSKTVVGSSELGDVNQAWFDEKMSRSNSRLVFAVTNLYSQNTGVLDAWQSQACFLESLFHPNIVKFLGHELEGKELSLFHEFMQNGSLENHLFRSGSTVQALSWNTRLKILIGAAQGLAFLHASKKQGFYEYFEPSDIMLDGVSYRVILKQYESATDEFSFLLMLVNQFASVLQCKDKIDRPNAFDDVHECFYVQSGYVYFAPENILAPDISTGFTNTKNDVYGFGVVLIETVTGLSGKGKYNLIRSGPCNLVEYFRSHLSDGRQFEKIVDSRLEGKYPFKAALQLAQLCLTCLDPEPKSRPSMESVVEALKTIEFAVENPKS